MRPRIGMFDSGVGGLTVARAVMERLPQFSLIYYGDTARAPYGCRSKEELLVFGREIVDFLLERRAEIIVVACNTSSAHVLEELRKCCPVPLIGVVDAAVALAGRWAPGKRIGLLATEATVASGAFERTAGLWNADRPEEEKLVWAVSQACPRFVPLVEAGLADSEEALAAACMYGEEMIKAGAEAVILGCTHYPFLRGVLRQCLGPEVLLLDPAEEVAAQVASVLREEGPFSERNQGNQAVGREWLIERERLNVPDCLAAAACSKAVAAMDHVYYVSGDPELFWRVGRALMGDGFHREEVEGVTVI